MCNRLVHLQSDCETIVQGCKFGLAGSRAARGGGERPPDASVAIRTWSACGACPPTRESWDYGVRAGEKARGKWSGRVPGVSGAASPRGGRSRTSYLSRYNYRHRYRYRRGIAASRAFRGCMQNKKRLGLQGSRIRVCCCPRDASPRSSCLDVDDRRARIADVRCAPVHSSAVGLGPRARLARSDGTKTKMLIVLSRDRVVAANVDGRRARIVDVPAHTRAHVRRLFSR